MFDARRVIDVRVRRHCGDVTRVKESVSVMGQKEGFYLFSALDRAMWPGPDTGGVS